MKNLILIGLISNCLQHKLKMFGLRYLKDKIHRCLQHKFTIFKLIYLRNKIFCCLRQFSMFDLVDFKNKISRRLQYKFNMPDLMHLKNKIHRYNWPRALLALSLIELVATMTILVILTSFTLGGLSKFQVKNRRQEAYSSLIKLKANIEQAAISGTFMQQNVSSVIDVATILNNNGSPQIIATPNSYYNISVTAVNAASASYTLSAVAQGQQSLRDDAGCRQINLVVVANKDDQKLPSSCW